MPRGEERDRERARGAKGTRWGGARARSRLDTRERDRVESVAVGDRMACAVVEQQVHALVAPADARVVECGAAERRDRVDLRERAAELLLVEIDLGTLAVVKLDEHLVVALLQLVG